MIMTRYEIENNLTSLYRELDTVNSMDEETVKRCCNADCKNDAIEAIKENINCYECALKELDENENRKLNYSKTADAPYLCW